MLGGPLDRRVVKRFAARAVGAVFSGLIAGALLLIALAFFSVAFYLWLEPKAGAPLAALATGRRAILAALIVLLAERLFSRAGRSGGHGNGKVESELAELLGADLARKIFKGIESHGPQSALAALIAGFAVGVSPRLRKLLRTFLSL